MVHLKETGKQQEHKTQRVVWKKNIYTFIQHIQYTKYTIGIFDVLCGYMYYILNE